MVFVAGSLALYVGGGAVFTAANIVAPGLAGCAVSLFRLTALIEFRDLGPAVEYPGLKAGLGAGAP